MKIAILAPECSPSWGGVGSYTYNLISKLPEKDEIHLVTLERNIEDTYEKSLCNRDIRIHKITEASSSDSFLYNAKFQLAILRNLKKLNYEYEFDLIHSHSGHLPHYLSQFQDIAPMVVTVHTESKGIKKARKNVKYKKDMTEILSDILSPIIEFGETITFKKANKLIPISNFTLSQINNDYKVETGNRAKVIFNGVDTNLFKPHLVNEAKNFTVSFVGRLYAVKGLDIFIESMNKILKSKYKINIQFVGRGNVNYIKKILSVENNTSYSIMGRVGYGSMPEIYNNSDLIILPSLYEGCSGTLLEAMSCERIVIASRVGGTPEIIKNGYNGLLFNPKDVNDLTEKVIDVLEERINISEMSKNARSSVIQNFDWKEKAKDIYKIYTEIYRN